MEDKRKKKLPRMECLSREKGSKGIKSVHQNYKGSSEKEENGTKLKWKKH